MTKLRDYQVRAVKMLYAAIREGSRKPLWVLPTGAGKSTVTAWLVKEAVNKGKRIVFVVHSEELVKQFSERLLNQFGIPSGIIMARHPTNYNLPVQVASLMTLVRRKVPPSDLLIIDEAHRARAASYMKIIDKYPQSILLGLTATPFRLDGKNMGDVFDQIVHPVKIRELIERGYLVGTKVYIPEESVDMEGVKIRRGDYDQKEMYGRFNDTRIYNGAVKNYKKLSDGKKALVFSVNVEHSKETCAAFLNAGIPAAHLDGKTPKAERRKIVRQFKTGDIKVLVNCQLFTEGFDIPDTEVVIMNRATQSLALHVQMVGRGLRPAEGKKECVVIDQGGNHLRHGFVEDYDMLPFTLENDKKKKKFKQGKKTRKCHKCGFVNPLTVERCRNCHMLLKRKQEKKVRFSESGGAVLFEAENAIVTKLQKLPNKKGKELPPEYLRLYQMVKGYKFGWLMHTVAERRLVAVDAYGRVNARSAIFFLQTEETVNGTRDLTLKIKKLYDQAEGVSGDGRPVLLAE